MRPLNTIELLDIWQAGSRQPLIEKTLRLIGVSCDNSSIDEMARLSIGERDLRLLQLREWIFGVRLHNTVHCPRCSELTEWEAKLDDLRLQPPRPDDGKKTFIANIDGYELAYRLPNSEDLYSLLPYGVPVKDPKTLLSRCILSLHQNQRPCMPDELPDTVFNSLAQQMEQEDPQADIRIEVHCPACTHSWEAVFDIITYLWTEIDGWARRTLEEVYLLALNFGWSEHAILTMPPQRRQLYIHLLRS
ncbi:MAG TPA: hypothetical protein VF939_12130 [Puia sp.]